MSEQNINTFQPGLNVKASSRALPSFSKKNNVCVIGAGAFGGWTALYLLRKGFKVTLIDSWGPGNSRSSSGDETRVIRSSYGNNELYFDLNVEALKLWQENEKQFSKKIFHNTGVLWFCYDQSNSIIDDSIPFSVRHKMEYQYLSADDLKKQYPEINVNDLHHAYFDPYGGYLKAREACAEVNESFIQEGGAYQQGLVVPGEIEGHKLDNVVLADGTKIRGDLFVFALGSWLPQYFPFLKDQITCTRQEVYYFGVPGYKAQVFDSMPVWIDLDGKDFYYGIPGNSGRGFKIGVDKRGQAFDPTHSERNLDPLVLANARRFISHRFPGLSDAPLVENRVCPYESSVSGNFIFDLHPDSENVFFLGGGSGHGFKHGPALGKLVANVISGDTTCPQLFRIF